MTWDDFALAFLSLDILRQAWPILLSGLVQTLLLSAMVVPLGLAGGVLLLGVGGDGQPVLVSDDHPGVLDGVGGERHHGPLLRFAGGDRPEGAAHRTAAAAATVADRLDQRAALATGVSAEVLTANAVLARDRGWAKEVTKQLKKGAPVEAAAVAATDIHNRCELPTEDEPGGPAHRTHGA